MEVFPWALEYLSDRVQKESLYHKPDLRVWYLFFEALFLWSSDAQPLLEIVQGSLEGFQPWFLFQCLLDKDENSLPSQYFQEKYIADRYSLENKS